VKNFEVASHWRLAIARDNGQSGDKNNRFACRRVGTSIKILGALVAQAELGWGEVASMREGLFSAALRQSNSVHWNCVCRSISKYAIHKVRYLVSVPWLPSCAALLAALLGGFPTWDYSAAAKDRPLYASVVATFDFQGKLRFCYDRDPAIIYFQYDRETNRTDLKSRSIDGNVRTVFQFEGTGNGRSLSCSLDGSTIAALDGDRKKLFILQGDAVSIYRFEEPPRYSVIGKYSLLSSDGSMIALPGVPVYVSGPDVLAQMRVLDPDKSERAFFEDGGAYVDEKSTIDVYRHDGGWEKQRSNPKPSGFYVTELTRCGSHVVASLSNDSKSSFKTLDQNLHGSADWLARIGVRSLLASFDDSVAIDGGYGQCVFPLIRKHDVRNVLEGIVTVDGDKVRRFKIKDAPLAFSDDEIRLSKDGCLALLRTFKQVQEIPPSLHSRNRQWC
jgi:hypothetical protein